MKYKVGDRVKIREDLNEDMENVVEEMISLAGKNVTIVTSDNCCYGIKEDQSGCWPGWDWQVHMIECKVEAEISEDEKERFWEGEAKTLGDALFLPLMKESMKPRVKYNFPTNPDALSSDAMEPDAQTDNMVNSPKHYMIGKYELIDFLDELAVHGGYSAVEWGYVLSILQYVCRAPKKNGLQDYQKAKWYLTRLVEMLEAKEKNG